jgi:autotransporter-associated beta strand protein
MLRRVGLVLAVVSLTASGVVAQTSFTTTAVTTAWSASRWNNTTDAAPYTAALTANNNLAFTTTTGTAFTFAGTGTIQVGNIGVADGVTVTATSASGTLGTSGLVRTITTGTGSVLGFDPSQAFSTTSGTGFIKSGDGILSLSGGAYNGGFTLNAGTVIVRGINAMGSAVTNTLTINGGAIVPNATRDLSDRYGAGISLAGNVTLGSTLTSLGGVTIAPTANLTFNNAVNLQGGTRTITIGGNGNYTFAAGANFTNGGLTIDAATGATGEVRLAGTNTYAGGTTVNNGRLRLDAVAALPTTGNVAVNNGGRLTFNIAGTYGTAGQTLTLTPNQTANPAIDTLSGAAVAFNGGLTLAADSRIEANGGAGSLTINGPLSGAGLLLKQGGGNLVLNGPSTLSGGTQVGNGTVTVAAASALGTGPLTLFQTSTNTTTVTLNNATQTVGNLSSSWTAVTGTLAQTVNLNGTALTVNQTGNTSFGVGAVATLTSVLNGTGSVTLSNASTGTLTLTGGNGYTGGTTINAGTLLANNATGSATGTGAVQVNGGTFGGTGTATGNVTVAAAGTVQGGAGALNQTLTTGNLTIQGGGNLALTVGGAAASDVSTATASRVNAADFGRDAVGSTIDLILTNDGSLGDLTGATTYTRRLATFTGLTNLAAGTYTSATTDFTLTGTNFPIELNWSVVVTGTTLDVTFTPVPEPATVLAVAAGGLGLARLRRRRA